MRIVPQKSNRAFAVLIVLLILAMMVAFVSANTSALFDLKREIKNVEKRQQLRWQKLDAAKTNSPSK
jgi:type II secretory pathway component PulK